MRVPNLEEMVDRVEEETSREMVDLIFEADTTVINVSPDDKAYTFIHELPKETWWKEWAYVPHGR